jgi:hypothetical protein
MSVPLTRWWLEPPSQPWSRLLLTTGYWLLWMACFLQVADMLSFAMPERY